MKNIKRIIVFVLLSIIGPLIFARNEYLFEILLDRTQFSYGTGFSFRIGEWSNVVYVVAVFCSITVNNF